MQPYETQNRTSDECKTAKYVWRCCGCGRPIATIEYLDGRLEVKHKCGALNRLGAVLPRIDEAEIPA